MASLALNQIRSRPRRKRYSFVGWTILPGSMLTGHFPQNASFSPPCNQRVYRHMSPEKMHKLDAVFGISRDLPETYVERDNIDAVLIESLARDKHIVIFESSKQGKTCLRKHCLEERDYIVASCQNNWNLTQLYSAILKAAGYSTQEARTKTANVRVKLYQPH